MMCGGAALCFLRRRLGTKSCACGAEFAFADVFAGLHAVIGIEAALIARAKTGKGQQIDISLLDSQVSVLANQALNYLVSGKVPKRLGNEHPNIVPYQTFGTKDGHIIMAVGNDRQFAKLCEVLGCPSWSLDERFASNAQRAGVCSTESC